MKYLNVVIVYAPFFDCSVFAGVAEPNDNSDSEPKSNSDLACRVTADEPVIDQKLKESQRRPVSCN